MKFSKGVNENIFFDGYVVTDRFMVTYKEFATMVDDDLAKLVEDGVPFAWGCGHGDPLSGDRLELPDLQAPLSPDFGAQEVMQAFKTPLLIDSPMAGLVRLAVTDAGPFLLREKHADIFGVGKVFIGKEGRTWVFKAYRGGDPVVAVSAIEIDMFPGLEINMNLLMQVQPSLEKCM